MRRRRALRVRPELVEEDRLLRIRFDLCRLRARAAIGLLRRAFRIGRQRAHRAREREAIVTAVENRLVDRESCHRPRPPLQRQSAFRHWRSCRRKARSLRIVARVPNDPARRRDQLEVRIVTGAALAWLLIELAASEAANASWPVGPSPIGGAAGRRQFRRMVGVGGCGCACARSMVSSARRRSSGSRMYASATARAWATSRLASVMTIRRATS